MTAVPTWLSGYRHLLRTPADLVNCLTRFQRLETDIAKRVTRAEQALKAAEKLEQRAQRMDKAEAQVHKQLVEARRDSAKRIQKEHAAVLKWVQAMAKDPAALKSSAEECVPSPRPRAKTLPKLHPDLSKLYTAVADYETMEEYCAAYLPLMEDAVGATWQDAAARDLLKGRLEYIYYKQQDIRRRAKATQAAVAAPSPAGWTVAGGSKSAGNEPAPGKAAAHGAAEKRKRTRKSRAAEEGDRGTAGAVAKAPREEKPGYKKGAKKKRATVLGSPEGFERFREKYFAPVHEKLKCLKPLQRKRKTEDLVKKMWADQLEAEFKKAVNKKYSKKKNQTEEVQVDVLVQDGEEKKNGDEA
eukprot:TRINITY_DN25539_c0_g1_i1.p1 TRINITY_DN25539_c0_g1~~TRINITY_DN25539_c0_g1_i1.p1  ORF type:complete len:357 (+),score=108.43 TRINITY_DN25539_c0_g1_i1:53-1123(+)